MDEPQANDQMKKGTGKGVDLFFEGATTEARAPEVLAVDEQVTVADGEGPVVGVYSRPDEVAPEMEATRSEPEPVPVVVPAVVAAVEAPAVAAALPPPPPPAAGAPQGGGTAGGGGTSLWPLVAATLLGAALSLLLLFLLNGSLRWPSQDDIEALQGGVTGLQQSQAQLSGDLENLEDGLSAARSDLGALNGGLTALNENLAVLGGDLTSLDTTLDAVAGEVSTQGTGLANANTSIEGLQAQVQVLPVLRDELTQAQEQLGDLQTAATTLQEQLTTVTTNVDTLTERVGVVAASARRSDDFLEGMRVVLGQVYGEGVRGVRVPTRTVTATLAVVTTTATITPAVPPTATVATATITPTVPVTATLGTPTPALAATATITATETLTATAEPAVTAPPVEAGRVSVRGTVFVDQNRNGLRDEGEPGLPNVRLMVRAPDQSQQRMVRSDEQGRYEFLGLPSGRYVVTQVDSSGYGSTTPNAVTVIVRGSLPARVDFGDYMLGQ
jgi:hypothetical protein